MIAQTQQRSFSTHSDSQDVPRASTTVEHQ